jgi:citrate lyase subunit beta/citryl-CoA lyase
MSFGLLVLAEPADCASARGLSSADALIVAASDAKAAATRLPPGGPSLLALLPPVGDAANREATMAALAAGVGCVLLAGACTAGDVVLLDARLAVAEARLGLPDGSTGVVAMAGGSARGVLALPGFGGAGARLRALAFDRESLAAELAAPDTEAALAQAETMLLLSARAISVGAVAGLAAEEAAVAAARAAERRGFSGILVRTVATAAAIAAALRR